MLYFGLLLNLKANCVESKSILKIKIYYPNKKEMDRVRADLSVTQKKRMKNAKEWGAIDEALKAEIDAH